MTNDIDTLTRLVRRHANRQPLPTHIVRDGHAVPLITWLEGRRTDQRPCPMATAMLLDHPAERPTVSEIAQTLAARIT
ncbi:hypothetical protein MTR72_24790 [Bradyrhizobium sp. ISRA442]|uniref:hypothetical protein n=1 Tax=Bradyrhizobium sp. ISRA442 TaxID=2866197 RepID=UPI00311AC4A5